MSRADELRYAVVFKYLLMVIGKTSAAVEECFIGRYELYNFHKLFESEMNYILMYS